MTETDQSEFEGLADIVSNLLAVFILLTMVVLALNLVVASEQSAQSGSGQEALGDYVPVIVDPFGRPVVFIVVDENGYTPMDKDALVLVLLDDPDGEVDLATVFETDDVLGASSGVLAAPSDDDRPGAAAVIDDMVLTFETTDDWHIAAAIPHGPDATAALMEMSQADQSISFVVFPSGIAAFVPVYEDFQASGVCFRWEPWPNFSAEAFRRVTNARAGAARCPV